jgi:ABC-type transport system substrate-binding protein
MKSMKVKIVVFLLLVGVLSACASPATNTPISQPPTEASVTATEAPATSEAAATDPATATESATVATEAPATGATVSFANDILPMLQSRCRNCHGGQKTEKELNLNSYEDVMAGSENGPVVTPGDAVNSTLAEMVVNGKMPKRGPKLTPDQVQLIVQWINQGAQNN